MKKLLLIAVLTLGLSLIVGVALAQEGEIEVVPEAEAKEGDIIEVRALSEAKPSDFIALGTSAKRVMEDFQDEATSFGVGELDLEQGKIIVAKGVHSPILLAPVKGDKIQFFGYLPENMLSYGREAMGIILEITEKAGKAVMMVTLEGGQYEMDLETGKVKMAEGQIQRGSGYWKCYGKCIVNACPWCASDCAACIAAPSIGTCFACAACGTVANTYCSVRCFF